MTTAAEDTEKAKAEAVKARNKEMEAREKKLNADKTGKGLRTFLGMTRGKGPKEIEYENWDVSQPDTLPSSFAEILDIMKTRGFEGDAQEKEVVRRWIAGDNEILYKEASDPVAEFVESTWAPDVQKQFKAIIKNYVAAMPYLSVDDAVNLIKPGFAQGLAKLQNQTVSV